MITVKKNYWNEPKPIFLLFAQTVLNKFHLKKKKKKKGVSTKSLESVCQRED